MAVYRQVLDSPFRSYWIAPVILILLKFSTVPILDLATIFIYFCFLCYMASFGIGGSGKKQSRNKNRGEDHSMEETSDVNLDNNVAQGVPLQKYTHSKSTESYSCKSSAKSTNSVERSEMVRLPDSSSVVRSDENTAEDLLDTSLSYVDVQSTCCGSSKSSKGNEEACFDSGIGDTHMLCVKLRPQKEQQWPCCDEVSPDSVDSVGEQLKPHKMETSPCFEEELSGMHGQPDCGMEQELIAGDTENEEEAHVIADDKPEDRGAGMEEEQQQLLSEEVAEPDIVGDNGQDEDDEDKDCGKDREVEEGEEDDGNNEDDDDDENDEDIESSEDHHEKDTDDEEDEFADEDIVDKGRSVELVQRNEDACARLRARLLWETTELELYSEILTQLCLEDCAQIIREELCIQIHISQELHHVLLVNWTEPQLLLEDATCQRLESGLIRVSNQIQSDRGKPVVDYEQTGNAQSIISSDYPLSLKPSPDSRETGGLSVTVLDLWPVQVIRHLSETMTIPRCISPVIHSSSEFQELLEIAETYSELYRTSRHRHSPVAYLEEFCSRTAVNASSDLTELNDNEIVVTVVASCQATPTQHPGLPTHTPLGCIQVSVGMSEGHQTAGQPLRTANTEVMVDKERESQTPRQPEDVDNEDQVIGRPKDDECFQGLTSDTASDSLSQSQTHTSRSSLVRTNDMLLATEGNRDRRVTSSTVDLGTLHPQCMGCSCTTSNTTSMKVAKLGCACDTGIPGIRIASKMFDAKDTVSADKSTDVAATEAVFPEKGEYDAEGNTNDYNDDDNVDSDEDAKLLMKDRLEKGTSRFQEQPRSKIRIKEEDSKEGGAGNPHRTAVSAGKLQYQEVMPFRDLRTKAAEDQDSPVTEPRSQCTKKSAKDSNGDDLDDLDAVRRSINRPLLPDPSFVHWTVGMVRSPYRQQAQNIQQNSAATAGLKSEWKRLSTFSQYEAPDGIFIIPIAGAGFFFVSDVRMSDTGEAKVECAFCSLVVVIRRFRGRNAMSLHAELSPQCGFVCGKNVGNVSIAETTERLGAVFLNTYSVSSGRSADGSATPRSPVTAPSLLPRRDPLTEVLATDSEPHAAEEPARISMSLPAHKPGSYSALPAVSGSANPAGSSPSGRAVDTVVAPQQQQLERDGRQGARSAEVGDTVADSRPAWQAGHGGSALPYQSATIVPPQPQPQPQPQPSSTGTEQASQPSTGNQPATSQTGGLHQTARVEAGPMTSLGTARAAAPANSTTAGEGGGGLEGEERNQNSGSGGGEGTDNSTERQLVTYEELGIFSQRPKRPDMALVSVRVNTFQGWPHDASHPREHMAEAGFYYTGHADLVRCFHCKGGLKTWESSDQPWIEHSRWFPRCPFIKLCKGQKFVQAVQKLNEPNTRPTITESDVMREIRKMEEEERRNLSSDVVLLETLPDRNTPADPEGEILARAGLRIDADVTEASMLEVAERLADENEELASSTLCKMCQTNEVNVLFLPCGHLVSCAQCAPALRTCAMCRQPVRGSVRVLLDEKRESEEMSQQNQSDGAAAT